jgi:hypothetical protein
MTSKKIFSLPPTILLDIFIFLFALWTLSSHVATYAKLSLYGLETLFGLLLVLIAIAVAIFCPFKFSNNKITMNEIETTQKIEFRACLWILLGTIATVLLFNTKNTHLFWFCSVSLLAVALFIQRNILTSSKFLPASLTQNASHGLVLVMAFVFACITLLSHRIERDDVNYHSTASYIADNPSETLYTIDPKHPAEKLPYLFTPHKPESLLLLGAALQDKTSLPVSVFFHLVLAGVAGFFTLLAHWKLAKSFTPTHWAPYLFAVEMCFLAFGETPRAWGLYGYPRLHEGKTVFVVLFVPLLIAYGLDLAEEFSWRKTVRFALAQIAAVGMTSTALWAGPIVGVFAFLAGSTWSKGQILNLLRSSLAFVYPVLIGLIVMRETATSPFKDFLLSREGIAIYYPQNIHIDLLEYAFIMLFKWTPLSFFGLFSMPMAWVYAPNPRARRFFLIYPLLFLGLILNPFLIDWLSRITCPMHYWRLFWLLPLPFFMGMVLIAPLTQPSRKPLYWTSLLILGLGVGLFGNFDWRLSLHAWRLDELLFSRHAILAWGLFLLFPPLIGIRYFKNNEGGKRAFLAFLLLLGVFYCTIPKQYALSTKSSVEIKTPGLRVPADSYAVAKEMTRLAGPSEYVLAPEDVALWLVSLSKHPSPLLTVKYWDALLEYVHPKEEIERRRWLSNYAEGRVAEDESRFAELLDRYPLRVVCLKSETPLAAGSRRVLTAKGFQENSHVLGFELWIKK